jgi:NadR type nicotinamide-nucleotide adenylyltransferase
MEKRSEQNCSDRLIKVAITGPESTGKSSLAEQLADHFQTLFVPEYAREYIDNLHRPYVYEDILEIAKGQLNNENKICQKASKIIFCDTDLIVTKIWSEHAYKKCDSWILENIQSQPYDLYLLMDIDLPWEYDPQREHPHMRNYFFNLYKEELSSRNLHYNIISGTGELRLNNAIKIVKNIFSL